MASAQACSAALPFSAVQTFGEFDENPAFPGLSRATEKNSHSRNLMADYTLDFASAGQLDLSLAYDRFNVRSFTNDTEVLPLLSVEDTWTDYDSTAAESIYRIDYQQHKLKIGTQLTARDFRQLRPFYRYQNDVLVQQGVVAHLAGIERAFGAFIEDDYALTPELQLTFGLRYDHNDLRLPGAELYPRFAVVFNPQDQRFGVKYSYNRGFVRPVLERSDGSLSHPVIIRDRFFLGPKVPQTSVSQDLQFSYTDERWLGSLTLYHYRLNDFIARLGYEPGTILNGYLVRYQNQNIGDLTGRGVELEANFQWSPLLKFYGNLALSRASFDDEETLLADGTATFSVIRDMHYADPQRGTTGVPRLLWNFGLDWQWAEHWFVNLHYRGWADNIGKVSTSNQFSRFGPEHFVDLNLIWREVGGSAAELQLYGKNLFGKTLLYPRHPGGLLLKTTGCWGCNLIIASKPCHFACLWRAGSQAGGGKAKR
ncbi:MAG: TonB-dependent receptor [Rheinheimera sp.]|nr:TonB-dependent receptor [Rheinheimera sp.]